MKIEEAIKQKKFKTEYQKLFINIIYTAHWIDHETIKTLKPYGISPQQYNVLRILKGQYPKCISMNQIIDRMLDINSNASRLVEKLKQKQLVEREICENDRRQVDIKITENGLKLVDMVQEKIDELNNFSKIISTTEAEKFNQFLDKIRV
ncbi:MAG: MarR family transcriptional regulator [Flavobacteriales bacterium]|nr:MarR family transcriptional regulator [Flavobacteriales bacterium]